MSYTIRTKESIKSGFNGVCSSTHSQPHIKSSKKQTEALKNQTISVPDLNEIKLTSGIG
jgi:hypothetical protein